MLATVVISLLAKSPSRSPHLRPTLQFVVADKGAVFFSSTIGLTRTFVFLDMVANCQHADLHICIDAYFIIQTSVCYLLLSYIICIVYGHMSSAHVIGVYLTIGVPSLCLTLDMRI